MERAMVLDWVPERHPDVSKKDAEDAWNNCLVSVPAYKGNPERYLAIGVDDKGRLLELVVVRKENFWLIIHGQTPPQEDIRRKLGVDRRKR